jgi:hydroxymethylpyrimidine kinase/phosphomethylpyrimidine kinase
MRRGAPVALTIAGSDSSGGAGVQADLKAFAVVGVHGASVITAITAQNSKGVRSVMPLDVGTVEAQMDAVAQDMKPHWAKTGLLHNSQLLRAVAGRLVEHDMSIVVDPVLTATSGDRLSEEGFVEAIRRELVPRAALLTPNVEEASLLLRGRRIVTVKELKMAAADLRELGATAVLVKGGHLEGTVDVVDVLCTGQGEFEEFRSTRLPGSHHGTGCTLSALVTGYLAKGDPMERAVARAERVQHTMMASAYPVGGGALYLDHMAPYKMAALRWEVARQVRLAAHQLELTLDGDWLPEIGTNIVYALPNATAADDVAALTGRIHRVSDHARAMGHVNFGASKYMARVVLGAMTIDGTVRAAVNIRRSPDHLRRAREAGLVVASFERADEPADAPKDLEWGTMEAIHRTGAVPDVIEDPGGHCLEPVMRVLGRDPADVVDKVRRIKAVD